MARTFSRRVIFCVAVLLSCSGWKLLAEAKANPGTADDTWKADKLLAWCIVPYDAKKRGPEERAQMLDRLGLRALAYDWRAEHVETFDREVEACTRHGIEIVAWWFPSSLTPTAQRILEVIERHGIRPQLWVTGGGRPTQEPKDQEARIEEELTRLRPLLQAAKARSCQVGLYNHGGWFGEPENQIILIERLRKEGFDHVGIVYNFHHGHAQVERFPELWSTMHPYVLAVNLNGMTARGDTEGKKILALGTGEQELGMMRVMDRSGWRGWIGLLNHDQNEDAEVALVRNRSGYDRLVELLRGER